MAGGKTTLYVATSVDGFIATEDGGVEWLDDFQDDAERGRFEEFFASVDCLVMGATTYEQVLGFGEWPSGRTPTYVVTGRDLPLATEAVELFDGPVDELARQLEERYDHVWLVGGAQLAQSYLAANEVNELRLNIVPVLLGSGISLFGDSGQRRGLDLTDVATRENGLVEVQYRVEG